MSKLAILSAVGRIPDKRRRKRRVSPGRIVTYLFLLGLMVFTSLPLVYLIVTSLKPLNELFIYPPRFFVSNPTLKNFSDLLLSLGGSAVPFSRYIFNSFLIASLTGTSRDWGRMFNKATSILKEDFTATMEVSDFSGEAAQCYIEFGIQDPANPTTNASGMAQVRVQNLENTSSADNISMYYYDPDTSKWVRGAAWVAWPEGVSKTDFILKVVGTVGESSTTIDVYVNDVKATSGSYGFFEGGVFGATTYKANTGCLIRSFHVTAASMTTVFYTVTAEASEGGTVSGVPARAVEEGTSVTLTAAAIDGYQFDGWYLDNDKVSDEAEYTFDADGNVALLAKFSLTPSFYSVKVTFDEKGGSISGIPEAAVESNTQLTLTASPKENYTFGGWYQGTDLLSSDKEYSVTVTESIELTAKFTYVPVVGLEDGVNLLEQGWDTGYGEWNQTEDGLQLVANNDNLDSAVFLPTTTLNNTEFIAEIKVSGFKGATDEITNPVLMMFFGLDGEVPVEFPAAAGRIDVRLQDQQASVYEWNPATDKASFATGRWQPVVFGEDFTLRIEMFRGNITVFVDGIEAYTWMLGRYLDEYTPGYLGFVTWGCASGLTISQVDVECADMTISTSKDPSPSVPDTDVSQPEEEENVKTGAEAPIAAMLTMMASAIAGMAAYRNRKTKTAK